MALSPDDYIEINRNTWNKKAEVHYSSAFYDVEGFLKGTNSLNEIELSLLGDVSGKSILHLQCHFGQDSLSLGRMGAIVTGADLSDVAIDQANELSKKAKVGARFICCDIYDLPKHLDEKFDIVFTSYGTIGWLPDLEKWARLVAAFLKPEGRFVMAEFHPVVWMFDDYFKEIAYNYFNICPIVETHTGTYADTSANITLDYVMWNHSLSEVISSLLMAGLQVDGFNEYDYSPYNCFSNTVKIDDRKYRIVHLDNKIPMVYSLEVSHKH
jgi:2-polyprenyl-3-methyl-5-hydroxy-6-metoxy-1,4-benzoquinol methylase